MRATVLIALLAIACEAPVVAPQAGPPIPLPPPTVVEAPQPKPVPRSPELLAARLTAYDALVAAGADAKALENAREAIDQAAAQRDAYMSRLYWYTSLDEAKVESARTGRPILSLRMLGRLDEEMSCANSRLFRIVLYANESVSKLLREQYVLHWSTERPVPKATLDFGDGRVVTRTVTGNSVHYVLDAQGRVVDALPGLFGPEQFERHLRESLDLAKRCADLTDDAASKVVAKYHLHTVWSLTATWRKRLEKAYEGYGVEYAETASLPAPTKFASDPFFASLPATAVAALTISKADTEAPTLALLEPEVVYYEQIGAWTKVAAGTPVQHLDARSLALLASKHPRDWSSPTAAPLDAAQLSKRVVRFETRLTEEGFRNEFSLHGAIHQRMAKPDALSFVTLNDFVYARVFMTPKSDPWLGLTPTEALTATDDDGLVAAHAE